MDIFRLVAGNYAVCQSYIIHTSRRLLRPFRVAVLPAGSHVPSVPLLGEDTGHGKRSSMKEHRRLQRWNLVEKSNTMANGWSDARKYKSHFRCCQTSNISKGLLAMFLL